MVMINPGTEGRSGASLENAQIIAARICAEFKLPPDAITRNPGEDNAKGFFGFMLYAADTVIELSIPGDDPDTFFLSKPFESRRMYVDGSSWLWRYAAGIISEKLGRE